MRDVEFAFEVLATTEHLGVARVHDALTRVPSGRRVRYDGIFLVRFDKRSIARSFESGVLSYPPDPNATDHWLPAAAIDELRRHCHG
jgi:hypothetical protein